MSKSNVQYIHAIRRELTLGERVALALASVAIHGLPSWAQQASNAYDMQCMLIDPASVGRGPFILNQAIEIAELIKGGMGYFIPRIDEFEHAPPDKFTARTRADLDALIAKAIEQQALFDKGYFHFGQFVAYTPKS